MSEAERRVVLLARAGVACERLRGALAEAGANLVLEGDPTVLDPQALDAADPDVVVVVLDPASEDALDRFENLLLDPSIEVIFEEAELAASREGWDAARWARHLSAKLNRHDDVLPPGREPEPEPDPMLIAEGFVRPATLEQELPSSQAPGSIFGFAEAAPAPAPTQEVAEELVAADVAADDGIEEIEAIEASETIEVIEAGEAFVVEDGFQAEPAAPSQVFDAGSVEPASDPSAFAAAEQAGELARVAPLGSSGDRILSDPPPLPDEAREFFARQALGSTPLDTSAGAYSNDSIADADIVEIEAYTADDDGIEELTVPAVASDAHSEPDFDFDGLTLEAVDSVAAVPGEARPYTPGLDEWVPSDAVQADLPPLDETGLGDMEAWRPPAPNQVHELIDLDAAFASEGARIDFDATQRDPTPIAPIDFDDGRGRGGDGVVTFESSLDFDLNDDNAPLAARAPAPPAPSVPDWSFTDEASLVSAATGQSGAHAGSATDAAAGAGKPDFNRHDLDEIERRISGLELVDDRLPVSTRNGAVLVLAGIGGPDAVRQLLGALPENFDRPVLVQQRLDGGRYDKLVAQMQRATPVLVKLAEVGARTIDGVIYILPAGVGIEAGDNGIQFVEGGDVFEALPAGDSAVLLFSGADVAQVDAAMKLSAHGALVVGQSPDGCYDAAAASAAIARGAGSGQPAELAAKLASRWSKQSPI
ncbi:chemotaxis protein CheB [Lysobacter capsici]|uniref:chemotaxis protein CheB n=1 Tax=Lysobacter capsici TaxID=435897 RepID=UPI0012FD810F|nr:chemotaxis protein CheB [Lysobacter capsici]